jgi:hypothetical protein
MSDLPAPQPPSRNSTSSPYGGLVLFGVLAWLGAAVWLIKESEDDFPMLEMTALAFLGIILLTIIGSALFVAGIVGNAVTKTRSTEDG